jgi:IS30 family transposase
MSYGHLSLSERHYIEIEHQAGTSMNQIAKTLKHLRHPNKTYRKRYGSAHNRTGLPNRVDIEQRPEEANERKLSMTGRLIPSSARTTRERS